MPGQTSQASKSSGSLDLTQGPILSRLCIFAAPILVGQLFQTLYNSVDSIVVGNFVGVLALSAVSASAVISMLLVGFFTGLSTGASVLFARLFGAKDYRQLSDAIHTTVLFSMVLGAVVALLGILFTPQLLMLVACPEDVYEQALVYLRIYLIGIFFTSVYNVGAGVLRSVGDSKSPFYYLMLSSCMNIVLDILLVAVLPLGVAGVAIATIIAQGTSVILVFRKMYGMDVRYAFRFQQMHINRDLLMQVLNLGLPAGLQTSITSISNMFVQRYINSFSSTAIAGISSAMKIDQFAGMPCSAIGLAMSTYIGQNIGAGKMKRTHKGVGIACLACAIIVLVVSIPVYIFAPQLMRLFGTDTDMITYGTGMLHTIMPVYLVMGANMLFGGVVRGYGYSKTSMVISLFGMVACRQIWLALSLSYEHTINNVYRCYPIGWIFSALPLVLFYLIYLRRKYSQDLAKGEQS